MNHIDWITHILVVVINPVTFSLFNKMAVVKQSLLNVSNALDNSIKNWDEVIEKRPDILFSDNAKAIEKKFDELEKIAYEIHSKISWMRARSYMAQKTYTERECRSKNNPSKCSL